MIKLKKRRTLQFFCVAWLFTVLVQFTGLMIDYPTAQGQFVNIDYSSQRYVVIAKYIISMIIIGAYYFINSFNIEKKVFYWFLGLVFLPVFSKDYYSSIIEYIKYFSFFVTMYIVYKNLKTNDNIWHWLFVICSLFIIYSLYLVAYVPQVAKMTGEHFGLWRGVFDHKNTFAIFVNLWLISYIRISNGKASILAIACFCYFLLTNADSSTNILLLFVTVFGYFFFGRVFSSKVILRKSKLLLFYSAFIFLFFVSYLSIAYFSQLMGKDITFSGRADIWFYSISIIMQNPIFGVGPTGVDILDYSSIFGWEVKSFHSSYVDFIIRFGFFGLMLLVFYLLETLRKSWVEGNEIIKYPSFIGLLIILIYALFESGAFWGESFVLLFLTFFILDLKEDNHGS